MLILSCGSCGKTTSCSGVPNVSVNFSIDIYSGGYAQLQYTGGAEEVTGGNAGIVIYRSGTDEFEAYDCMCPYDGASNSAAAVQIQKNNPLIVTCPVCGSSFLLSTGSVSKGPSACPLKPYRASYDGISTLTVTN